MSGGFTLDESMMGVAGTGLRGVYGLPWLSLEPLLDLSALDAVHEEVCVALASLPTDYTGGSHRSMGIMPEELRETALTDYAEVIRGLDDAQFAVFRGLADDPSLVDRARREGLAFGEERDVLLSRRQMLWLEYRFGVYFPWKVYYEMIPNRWWTEKHDPQGKRFTRAAESLLPKTVALAKSLPFTKIGRCNIMGLRAHDYGTVHRDGHPEEQSRPDEFITLCPAQNKTLFLYDRASGARTRTEGRALWFNDFDDHGVEAAPYFRYSIRVDGVFREDFRERVRSHARLVREQISSHPGTLAGP
ncbi:MAG: hypothetical protein JNK05_39820 [Myxococcales bacterium]|nr:hypothetical protein [Myxococcales bacterium]